MSTMRAPDRRRRARKAAAECLAEKAIEGFKSQALKPYLRQLRPLPIHITFTTKDLVGGDQDAIGGTV